jgi:hypothetical protein
MFGSRLQMSHRVTFSMECLVAPFNSTFPQLCVDPLDPFRFPALPFARWPRVRVRTHFRYVSGRAKVSITTLCVALPSRVGPILALVHGFGVAGNSLVGHLHHLVISIMPQTPFGLTVDLVFLRPLLVDKDNPAVPGVSIPLISYDKSYSAAFIPETRARAKSSSQPSSSSSTAVRSPSVSALSELGDVSDGHRMVSLGSMQVGVGLGLEHLRF